MTARPAAPGPTFFRAGLLNATELTKSEPLEPSVPEQHTFVLTFEASGEVTPAPQPEDAQPDTDTTEPEPEEAEQ